MKYYPFENIFQPFLTPGPYKIRQEVGPQTAVLTKGTWRLSPPRVGAPGKGQPRSNDVEQRSGHNEFE